MPIEAHDSPVPPDHETLPPMAAQLFTEARSHGRFLPERIPEQTLHELYGLMRWGPTSMNCQPLRIRFVVSEIARRRLLPAVKDGNVEKCRAAPVVAVLGYNRAFAQRLPVLFPPVPDARALYEADPSLNEETAFRNANLQAGYFILAARMLGLDVGPLSGFDIEAMDGLFWQGQPVRTTMLCLLGHADPTGLRPRLKRLPFDEVCSLV